MPREELFLQVQRTEERPRTQCGSDSWVWRRCKRLEKVSQAGGTGASPKESAEFLLGKKERISGRIIWIKILKAGESMKYPEHPGNFI